MKSWVSTLVKEIELIDLAKQPNCMDIYPTLFSKPITDYCLPITSYISARKLQC